MVYKVIDELPRIVAIFRIWTMTDHSTSRIQHLSKHNERFHEFESYDQYAIGRNAKSTHADKVARLQASRQ